MSKVLHGSPSVETLVGDVSCSMPSINVAPMNSDANDGLPSDLRPQVRQIMHAFSSVLYSFKFRAYNISRRKPWVLWFLLATFIVLSAVRTMFISFVPDWFYLMRFL